MRDSSLGMGDTYTVKQGRGFYTIKDMAMKETGAGQTIGGKRGGTGHCVREPGVLEVYMSVELIIFSDVWSFMVYRFNASTISSSSRSRISTSWRTSLCSL